MVEEVEGELGVKKGSCYARRSSWDISTNHCLGTTAEEGVETVGVQDNCSSRRTPSGMDAYQLALLRKSTSARDISKN